ISFCLYSYSAAALPASRRASPPRPRPPVVQGLELLPGLLRPLVPPERPDPPVAPAVRAGGVHRPERGLGGLAGRYQGDIQRQTRMGQERLLRPVYRLQQTV